MKNELIAITSFNRTKDKKRNWMLTIEIDGNNFSNLSEFYTEIEQKMTKGLDWKIGRNLNAFIDILRGGFCVHACDEDYKLLWINSQKSKSELKEYA